MLNKKFTRDDLPNTIMRDIYQYWLGMKGNRPMPSRADLNPVDLGKLLPHLSLIDVEHKTGRYKFRLIGTETVKGFGVEFTGKYLDEIPQMDQLIKTRCQFLVKEKRPYLYFDQLKWSRKSFLDYYALGLPLSSNRKDVDILLYGMYYLLPSEKRSEFFN